MIKFVLYLVVIPVILWAMDSININAIFKKNRVYQARITYLILVFSFSYLFVGFLYDLLTMYS